MRRKAIVSAAVEVFAELGYDGASLREVADRSGMQKGHLAYYFPSKHDLLGDILDDLYDAFLAGFDVWVSDEQDPLSRLQHMFAGHVRLVCARRNQTLVGYESIRFLDADRRQAITARRNLYEQKLAALIDDYRASSGLVADVPTSILTKCILGLLNWIYQWYHPGGHYTVDELSAVMSERAMMLLAPVYPQNDGSQQGAREIGT